MRNVAACVALVFTLGCGKLNEITDPGGGLPPVDPTATFSRVQTEIFSSTCTAAGCHDALGRQQGLVLTAGQSYVQLVGVPSEQMPALRRVAPGNFADSYLYRKLTGVGITGQRMPQGGPFLDAARLSLVRDWIRKGAPND